LNRISPILLVSNDVNCDSDKHLVNEVARRCTFSSNVKSFTKSGLYCIVLLFHACTQYSRVGLTKDLYSVAMCDYPYF